MWHMIGLCRCVCATHVSRVIQIAVLACLLFGVPGESQGDQTDTAITPPDVFAKVAIIHQDLEQVRFIMGRPKNDQPEIQVSDAAPREVYFQALTLFRKADRLGFEHTRTHVVEPEAPDGQITPADVFTVVTAALERLQAVKERLEIDHDSRAPDVDPQKTPTDVFKSIVDANRQLNLLLEHQYTPSDVFQQATLGVAYLSRLLERFPEAAMIPEEPPFEPGKRPADVYRRVDECFERICRIARETGETCLTFRPDAERVNQAVPSDVYDIASLLVSELAHLHAKSGAAPPRKVYYPGRKFPSHVYQRVGLLERQLDELERLVEQNPDWLSKVTGAQ